MVSAFSYSFSTSSFFCFPKFRYFDYFNVSMSPHGGADGEAFTAIGVVKYAVMVCVCPRSVPMAHLQQWIDLHMLNQQVLLEQYNRIPNAIMMPPKTPILVTVLRWNDIKFHSVALSLAPPYFSLVLEPSTTPAPYRLWFMPGGRPSAISIALSWFVWTKGLFILSLGNIINCIITVRCTFHLLFIVVF